ncbi:MAG: nucleotidyl transferase AbiEii/AbiGii toxin family protein [Candidatus Micrarchaeota archaeon]|nr:nucleotidyl transferase AbiEii/AbiGii toxin family protein [Candidatus Micrarchaeota archaeon]
MQDPIELSLKTELQIAMARLQDKIVESIFNLEPGIVMHGGTAVWRCYNGNRFSDDIDIYATDKQTETLNHKLDNALSKRGVRLDYPKYSARSLECSDGFATIKLQAQEPSRPIRSVQRGYTRSNGTLFPITTMSASAIVIEKIETYKSRRYARDLYDIYHLISNERLDVKAIAALKAFYRAGVQKPADMEKLADLVYAGAPPTFDTMLDSIGNITGNVD